MFFLNEKYISHTAQSGISIWYQKCNKNPVFLTQQTKEKIFCISTSIGFLLMKGNVLWNVCEVSLVNTINKNSMVRSILGVCDPAKAASLLSSLFNNPSFGRFLSVKPFVPKPVPRVNHDEAKCLQKKVGSLAGHMNTIVRSLKGRLIKLVQSKSFRPPSASGFSVGTISFKRVNMISYYLMIPYLLWCCYALFLNLNLLILN